MATRFTLDDLRNSAAGKLNAHLFQDAKPKAAGRAKYNNTKVYWMDMVFDSKKEYKRYRLLLFLLKKGIIARLQRQVKYLLIEEQEGEKKVEYWADHVYIICETGAEVVEDVKSDATRKLSTYIIKRKLMLSVHGIKIKEV